MRILMRALRDREFVRELVAALYGQDSDETTDALLLKRTKTTAVRRVSR